MSGDYHCVRCGKGYDWEKMTSTPSGSLFCPDCWLRMDPKNEPTRKCPVDGGAMTKRLVSDVVLIDTCAQCGGIWFDKGELEVIKKRSKDAGWNQGFVIGMLF